MDRGRDGNPPPTTPESRPDGEDKDLGTCIFFDYVLMRNMACGTPPVLDRCKAMKLPKSWEHVAKLSE
ncbi:hypothetical protein diail_4321 [Diaporthe ilicicola]|nr:hypothetical protein diail_4321 [Diaporthe ilicicola]